MRPSQWTRKRPFSVGHYILYQSYELKRAWSSAILLSTGEFHIAKSFFLQHAGLAGNLKGELKLVKIGRRYKESLKYETGLQWSFQGCRIVLAGTVAAEDRTGERACAWGWERMTLLGSRVEYECWVFQLFVSCLFLQSFSSPYFLCGMYAGSAGNLEKGAAVHPVHPDWSMVKKKSTYKIRDGFPVAISRL